MTIWDYMWLKHKNMNLSMNISALVFTVYGGRLTMRTTTPIILPYLCFISIKNRKTKSINFLLLFFKTYFLTLYDRKSFVSKVKRSITVCLISAPFLWSGTPAPSSWAHSLEWIWSPACSCGSHGEKWCSPTCRHQRSCQRKTAHCQMSHQGCLGSVEIASWENSYVVIFLIIYISR